MSIEPKEIIVGGIRVAVIHKAIKNLHLGVYPPNGRVRIAAPLAMSDAAIRLAAVRKLGWIKRNKRRFQEQPRQSAREMVNGESHYYLGQRYRLRVVEVDGAPKVDLSGGSVIKLSVRPKSTADVRSEVLQSWYRQRLKDMIPPLLEKWQDALGVRVTHWGVKKMKTRWGTCNPTAKRIWLNLELVKKPSRCLELILVHELAHLIERKHNDRFVGIMNKHLPKWKLYRSELAVTPLGHDVWEY
jgi:predicted metal-dependent hydrolase